MSRDHSRAIRRERIADAEPLAASLRAALHRRREEARAGTWHGARSYADLGRLLGIPGSTVRQYANAWARMPADVKADIEAALRVRLD